jgi:hypothetical protein
MSRLFGRCERCHTVAELYPTDMRALCEDCARTQRRYSRRYTNDGRPTLPTDGYNHLIFDYDELLQQL